MFGEWRARAAGGGDERPVTVPGSPAAFAGADAVTYTTTFPDPRGSGDDIAVLGLHGVYARADLQVTGERLGDTGPVEHDVYFEPLRVAFRPEPDNTLSVTCHSPSDRFGGLHDTGALPDGATVPGIWWGASLETGPLPYVDRVRVRPELLDGSARLHVRTSVLTAGPLDDRITYSLTPTGDLQTRGTMDRGRVVADGPGRTTVEHTIELRDPSLWWPRHLGAQHRYTLRARLGDSERAVTTGVCGVERDGGRLSVNGRPIAVRGVVLLTADPADVERAVDLGVTVVRAPANVLPPAVYEACDEAGLLVWQGLPLTGPGGFSVERGRRMAAALGAYTAHPSLAVCGVHDEPTDLGSELGDSLPDRLRLRWRAWRADYDRTDADAVAAALPPHRPAVPVVGGPGIDHDAAAYYPGRDYGVAARVDELLARYPTDLLAAFGAPAPDADADPARAHQREVLVTVAETARRRGLGAVAAALRDPAPGGGMGVYAADGTPKPAREGLAGAFEPVRAFLADRSPGESTVVVVNDGPDPIETTLSWCAGDAGGGLTVVADPMDRWTGTIRVPPGADAVDLAVGDPPVEHSYALPARPGTSG